MTGSADEAIQPCTALVVLGAAVWPGGEPSPTLARRIARAAELYHAGRAQTVIGSGGTGRWPPSEAEVIRDTLIAQGVPVEAVLMETASTTTFENALNAIPLMRAHGLARAILVTDAYHLPRALLTFRMLGMAADGFPAAPDTVLPRLQRVWYWLREGLAMPFYMVRLLVWRARNHERMRH